MLPVFAVLILAVTVGGVVVSLAGSKRRDSMLSMIGLSVALIASFPAVLYALIDGG